MVIFGKAGSLNTLNEPPFVNVISPHFVAIAFDGTVNGTDYCQLNAPT